MLMLRNSCLRCAELERLKQAEGPEIKAQRIDVLIKEMEERAQVFGLTTVEAIRWRELASFPRIVLPEEREQEWMDWTSRDCEYNDRIATKPFITKQNKLTIQNGFYSH